MQVEKDGQAKWYIDSGCSCHMTGSKEFITSFQPTQGGNISFGNKRTGKIKGIGEVSLNKFIKVQRVNLVEDLKFNLLSVAQLCDQGKNQVIFSTTECHVVNPNQKVVLAGKRVGNTYLFDQTFTPANALCLSSLTEQSKLWHQRFGHASLHLLDKLQRKELVRGLPRIQPEDMTHCSECSQAKQTRASFPIKKVVSTSSPLELVHMDLCGPMRIQSTGGNKYIFVLVDDYTRYTWTLFLRSKDQAYSAFFSLISLLENSLQARLRALRSDNGLEFKNSSFLDFCRERGIEHNFSSPRTPQQNGVVERKNRTLEDMARTMLFSSKLPHHYWAQAVDTACYIINRAMLRPLLEKTPYELMKGRAPNISHLRVFGCKCYVHNNGKDQLGKFDLRSDEATFLGYSSTSKAYKVLNRRTNKIEESIHVKFDEHSIPNSTEVDKGCLDACAAPFPSSSYHFDEDPGSDLDSPIPLRADAPPFNLQAPDVSQSSHPEEEDPSVNTQPEINESVRHDLGSASQQEAAHQPIVVSPSRRTFQQAKAHPSTLILSPTREGVTTRSHYNNLCAFQAFVSLQEPKNIQEALKDVDWIQAMQEELEEFKRNKVWHLVPQPHKKTIIGTRWVFRNKLDDKGSVIRNKARLVAQGYNQQEGIDYDETYAPVARIEAIRLLIAFASFKGFKLFQMDVKTAFLNDTLNEEVYVKQPPGFEDARFPNHVYFLDKALYGLKQAPRAWYDCLSDYLASQGYRRGTIDKTLFLKEQKGELLIVQVYVDDIIFGSTNRDLVESFKETMSKRFNMSLIGELKFFLGLQINQKEEGIEIHQQKYLKEILQKYEMESSKPFPTPLSITTKLDQGTESAKVNETSYRGMVGSLMYLTASRPDILFATSLCARFQCDPRESHLSMIKRIFRYLKGSDNLCLWYPKFSNFNVVGFTDADYAGFLVDRKSTSGMAQFIGPCLVSWGSKKQNSIALSTTEAEYIAAAACCSQLLWLKQQLEDYGVKLDTLEIKCDNTSAINVSKNPVHHSRTKHIDVRHHFLRDHVEKGNIMLTHCRTEEQLADIFTKGLSRLPFQHLRVRLGLIPMSKD